MNNLEFVTVFLVGILPSAVASIAIFIDPRIIVKQNKYLDLLIQFVKVASIITLLLYISSRHNEGINIVGFSSNGFNSLGILVMLLGFLLLFSYTSFNAHIQKRSGSIPKTNPAATNMMRYKTFSERVLFWISMATGVLAEDMLYRGYLVLGIGVLTGNWVLWVLISICLSIIIHLYQREALIGYHIIIATTFVLVASIMGNIVLVVIFHLLWNTLQVIRIWQKADQDHSSQSGKDIKDDASLSMHHL